MKNQKKTLHSSNPLKNKNEKSKGTESPLFSKLTQLLNTFDFPDQLKAKLDLVRPSKLINFIQENLQYFSNKDLIELNNFLLRQKQSFIPDIIPIAFHIYKIDSMLGSLLLETHLERIILDDFNNLELKKKTLFSIMDTFILCSEKWILGNDSKNNNQILALFIAEALGTIKIENNQANMRPKNSIESLNRKIFQSSKWALTEFNNTLDYVEEKRDLGRRMLASLPNDFPDEWKQELDQLYTELISKSFQAKEEPLSPANLPHIGAEEIKPPEEAPQAESVGEDAIQQSPSQPEIERVPEPLPEMKPAEALLREELQPAEPASEKETPIPPPESEVTPDSPEILNTEKVDGRTLLTEVLNWKDGQIKTLTLHRDQIIQQLGKLVELKGILEKTLATVIDTRGKGSPICLAIDHEFKSLNREMAQFEEQKRGLESQLAEAENEYLQLCQIESVLMVEFQKSDQILEAQKRELQLLTGQCQSLEHKLETTGQTLDQTSRELEEVVQQNWQLQADLNQARSEAVTAKTTLKRELEAFQLHLDEVLEKHLSEKLGAVHRSLVPHFQNFRAISKSIPSADMAECLVEWVQDLKKILKEKGIGIWE